jgi:hypothetical protein
LRNVLKILPALFVLALASSGTAYGQWSGPRPWRWLLQVSGDFHYSQSEADYQDGLTYTQQFGTGGVGALALGRVLGKSIYIGARYEYWYAYRKFSGLAGSDVNRLDYQGLAAEVGYRWGSPRSFWLVSAGLVYPLKLQVTTKLGAPYVSDGTPLAYQGRFLVGLRLNGFLSLLFTAGYRYADLGDLRNPTSLTANPFDLSGPFGGVGLGFTF